MGCGHDDHFPVTDAGRALGVALMFSSIILVSLFTATVSPIFVAKKIQEGKGLEQVTFENHILVCGWNEHALRTLERLNAQGDARDVVLINQLAPEDMEAVVSSYSNLEVRFTRGDFTREEILDRARIRHEHRQSCCRIDRTQPRLLRRIKAQSWQATSSDPSIPRSRSLHIYSMKNTPWI